MSKSLYAMVAVLTLVFCAVGHAGEPGFKTIFNGKDLTGWDGRPGFWKVMDGHIRGQTTPQNKAPGNTFLIWRGGKLKDFELKITYRILTGNNSGVQYRSKEVSKWVVSGYQAEVQNQLNKTGFLYHEKGRGWMVDVGDFMEVSKDGQKSVVGVCADQSAIIKAPYHTNNEWNEYHFICRGNHVIHILNGYQTVEMIDKHVDQNKNSLKQRCMEGVLAVQIHGGGPMTVDYKDIRIRQLTDSFGEAKRLFNGKDLSGWSKTGNWSVKPLSDESSIKARRRAKAIPFNVLACSGESGGSISTTEGVGQSYILRYQRRANRSDTAGKLKAVSQQPVLGWETVEVTVNGKKASVKVNGVASDEKTMCGSGKVAISSKDAAEYRNIVLIPIAQSGS